MKQTHSLAAQIRAHHAAFWGLLLCATPLTVLASVLHRYTHHRPLGAVTFALVASVVLVVGVLVARRCSDGGIKWLVCRVAASLSAAFTVLALVLGL